MRESGTVRFLLNEQEIVLDFHNVTKYTPTTTLLNFIRENPLLTGTKEGCAEGDCGACTVAIAHLDSDNLLHYDACDSCLMFLPMLHGKALITVEHIGTLDQPHPVQSAMVDYDGSQCGYCTPGFIMSMFALHQNHENPNRDVVADALTGNLCRCTGYRSIMEAAMSNAHPAIESEFDEQLIARLKEISQYPLDIMGSEQKYFKPIGLEEAVRLRSMYPEAILINGATDVALKVTKQHQLLSEIIDLSGVRELSKIAITEDQIIFGAGTSLEQVKQVSESQLPALFETLKVFGSLQIRNLATLGGNIGSASPIGDTPPILMAYEAQVELTSMLGTRKMLLSKFITGYRQTELAPDELITKIIVPIPAPDVVVKWYKISKRKDLDISTISGGFKLLLDDSQKVMDLELYYGGMAAMTKKAEKTQQYLVNKVWSREHVETAMNMIDDDFTPISDARASAYGRQVMARNILFKFWSETHD